MEAQQMMELLLARMNASIKEHARNDGMNENQPGKGDANGKADQAKTDKNRREISSTVKAIKEKFDAAIHSMRAW
jgi:hypothetical protein